jgi:hypothetical protein
VEVLFAAIDDLEYYFAVRNLKGKPLTIGYSEQP